MATSMGKKITLLACSVLAALALAACSAQSSTSATSPASSDDTSAEASASGVGSSQATGGDVEATQATFGAVANTLAQDEDALVSEYASKFTQETYADAETGLSVTYNLFLPQGYDASKSYPMVVFIADSSCAKGNAEQSLTQGLGALGAHRERRDHHRTRGIQTY